MEKQRIIEIALGIFFIFFLVAVIFAYTGGGVSSSSNENNYESAKYPAIINSYNTYNFYGSGNYQKDYQHNNYHRENYLNEKIYEDHTLYNSWSRTEYKEGLFGNNIKQHTVSVKNTDDKPGYFTVRFYFEDYHGQKYSETETKFIRPHEEKEFFIKKIYDDRFYYNGHKIYSN